MFYTILITASIKSKKLLRNLLIDFLENGVANKINLIL